MKFVDLHDLVEDLSILKLDVGKMKIFLTKSVRGPYFGPCHIITVVATDDGRNTYFSTQELSHHGG